MERDRDDGNVSSMACFCVRESWKVFALSTSARESHRLEIQAPKKNDVFTRLGVATPRASFSFNYKVINAQSLGNTVNDSR